MASVVAAAHPYNTCFRARNVDFMVFAPRGMDPSGMDPRVMEDAIQEVFDLAEPAPPRIAAGDPPRVNRDGIVIFMGTGLGELGPDSDRESGDAN
ncbi:hypothetical protein PC128_g23227 [Phytophthora cactorum]|nr:hypothetical protein PC120_g23154 [Phytophthora cactorum]KAG3044675.1 hypothetical protein PC121_g21775 [Phytophthora cactorum]KAG3150320.1 hypothetical protein PC128_g23227 [Phytophthora cactorum]KAG4043747.1 hypothetical protein PC123_g20802 [Phytophthora cactorum]